MKKVRNGGFSSELNIKKPWDADPEGTRTERRACAACRHQRRKCTENCPLAQYFPADEPKKFLNAHKLFGLRNLNNLVKDMPQVEKDIAMRTMIYEGNVRENDRVGGCLRVIQDLKKQIQLCEAQVDAVRQQIAFHRTDQALQDEYKQLISRTSPDGEDGIDKDAFSFRTSRSIRPSWLEYNGLEDEALLDIPFPSEPLLDGSSSSGKEVVPKCEDESDQNKSQQVTELRNAASHFSLKNKNGST